MKAAPPPAATANGHETILAVKDNQALRNLAIRQLKRLGYNTLAAADAAAAMNVIRSGATIDLLFTDVIMPGGMDGWALAEAGRAVRRDLKTLFTSGYTAAAAATAMAAEFGAALLSKPYRSDALALRVRAAIVAPRPHPRRR